MKRMNNVKNAIAAKIMGSIVIGMTVVAGVTPITVFAQDKEAECICEEKCTQDSINEECEVCIYDYNFCEGKKQIQSLRKSKRKRNTMELLHQMEI